MASRRRPLETRTSSLVGRSRGDRLLDGVYRQQTRDLRKLVSQKSAQKRPLLERRKVESAATAAAAAKKVKVEPTTAAAKSRSPLDALQLIVKHLNNRQKFSRVVKMLRVLFDDGHMNQENHYHFVMALYKLGCSDHCTNCEEARSDILALFRRHALPLRECSAATRVGCPSAATASQQEAVVLDSILREVLDVAMIQCLYHNGMQTDDTYEFNCNMSHLSEVFECLKIEFVKFGGPQPHVVEEALQASKTNDNDSKMHQPISLTTSAGGAPSPNYEACGGPSPNQVAADQRHVATPTEIPTPSELSVAIHGSGDIHEVDDSRMELESEDDDDSNADTSLDKEPYSYLPAEHYVKSSCRSGTSESVPSSHATSSDTAQPTGLPGMSIPTVSVLREMRRRFFFDCLGTAFGYRNKSWARVSVEEMFDKAYRSRNLFTDGEQQKISKWQSEIKIKRSETTGAAAVYCIGESPNPVKDGRDERISTIHGSAVWSAKQTGL